MKKSKRSSITPRAVMADAWSIYHAVVAEEPASRSRATWAASLSWAWERAAESAPEAVRAHWTSMTPEQQIGMLHAMIRTAAARELAESYNEPAAWLAAHELDALTDSAWIGMAEALDRLPQVNESRAARGAGPLPLALVVYRAAKAAIHAVIRDDIRHGVAQSVTITDPDTGERRDYIDTMVRARDASTEQQAIIRAAVEDVAALSPQHRLILALVADGATVRQIAEVLALPLRTTQRRIEAIRAALALRLAG